MENQGVCQTPASELREEKKREKINFKFKTRFGEQVEDRSWCNIYFNRSYFKFEISPFSYFDPRPRILTNITSLIVIAVLLFSLLTLSIGWAHLLLLPFLFFGWGDIYLKLPFDTGKDQSEHPSYGFYVYHIDPVPGKLNIPSCVIWQWGNYNSYDFPWAYTWVRSSVLLKNDTWEHEIKGDRKDFYEDKWKDIQYRIDYLFFDKSDETLIPTKVYVEEREWRAHWLKWTSLFSLVRRTIDVDFSKEVGSRKGSWKGGTVGCGYNMKKGETALECIKRMQEERVFR